ncbi:MAG: hypothetical protein QM765_38045 [Myxococcales bacterium]
MDKKTLAKDGLVSGLLVGALFAAAEMVGSQILGASPVSPWRAFASTALGQRALEQVPLATALPVGVVAHFVLSALYGVAYAFANRRLCANETRSSFSREAGLGLFFGLALYVVNFQVFARLIYPWFLGANQVAQLIYHVFFFGLPLALLITVLERKALGIRAPTAARSSSR